MNYIVQEVRKPETSSDFAFPKPLIYSQLTTDDVVRQMHEFCGFNSAMAEGVLKSLSAVLWQNLLSGHNVRIDGLGTFSLSLAFDDEDSKQITTDDDMHYRRVCVKGLNFRPSPDLLRTLNRHAQFERAESAIRHVRHSPYTLAERAERARRHILRHGYITLAQYAALNHLCRTAASIELRRLCVLPDAHIRPQGRAPHRVWVLNEGDLPQTPQIPSEEIVETPSV